MCLCWIFLNSSFAFSLVFVWKILQRTRCLLRILDFVLPCICATLLSNPRANINSNRLRKNARKHRGEFFSVENFHHLLIWTNHFLALPPGRCGIESSRLLKMVNIELLLAMIYETSTTLVR